MDYRRDSGKGSITMKEVLYQVTLPIGKCIRNRYDIKTVHCHPEIMLRVMSLS